MGAVIFGAGTIAAAVFNTVVYAGAAYYAASRAAAGAKQKQDDIGASVTKSGVNSTRNVFYGYGKTSSVNVYNDVKDDDASLYASVFTIGVGKLTYIHNVFIDDVRVLANDGNHVNNPSDPNSGKFSGDQISGDFNGQEIQLQIRNGHDTEAYLKLIGDHNPTEWTAAHRGDRVAQVGFVIKRSLDEGARVLSDQFAVSALVSGLAVYDPRYHTDTTKKDWKYTKDSKEVVCGRNPSCCLLDYLTNDYYGLAIDFKYLDLESFKKAANYCDVNDLYIDGEINSGNSFSQILEDMLSTFGGVLTIESGQIKCKFEQKETPIISFDESNIIGSFSVTNQSTSNYWNSVSIDYKSFDNREKTDTYILPSDIYNDSEIKAYGKVETRSIKMPLTVSGHNGVVGGAVKLLANREYRRAKYQKSCTFKIDLESTPVEIYDVVNVSNKNLNWVNKEFRIVAISTVANDGKQSNVAEIKLSEYSDFIYDGTADGDAGKPKDPPKPIPEPTLLKFDQTGYDNSGYGLLSWQATAKGIGYEYEVQYSINGADNWAVAGKTNHTKLTISGLKVKSYDFRVRTTHPVKGASRWAILNNQEIEHHLGLPEVTGVVIDATNQDFVINWDEMKSKPIKWKGSAIDDTNPDANGGGTGTVLDYFSYYQIDIFHFENNQFVFKKRYSTQTETFNYPYLENVSNGANRKVKAAVKIVSVDGVLSPDGAASTAEGTNPQIGAPSGVGAQRLLQSFLVNWEARTEDDYKETLIHWSFTPYGDTTPTDTPKAKVLGGTQWGLTVEDDKTRYLKFAHRDLFDDNNLQYSAQLVLKPQNINDLLPDIGDDLAKIRDPDNAITKTGEYVVNVASDDITAGYGLFTDPLGRSDVILSGDRVIMAAGGHGMYKPELSYTKGWKVITGKYGEVEDAKKSRLWEAKKDVPKGNAPAVGSEYWDLINANLDQALFTMQADGRMIVELATIEDLTSKNIKSGSILGGDISSTTTVTAGSGTNTAGINGDPTKHGDNRFFAGAVDGANAPYRVTNSGKMISTNAEVKGKIEADSGYFKGSLNVNGRFVVDNSGNVTITSESGNRGMKIYNDHISVYDERGVERVRMGKL